MNNIYELYEIAGSYIIKNELIPKTVQKDLNEVKLDTDAIGLAQINPISGNIEYNALKIARIIKYATEIGLELIVFPEYVLTGYSLEDAMYRHDVIAEDCHKWLNGLAKITKKTTAVVGFTDNITKDNNKICCTSIAILKNGNIQKIIHNNDSDTTYENYAFITGKNVLSEEQKKKLINKETKLIINSSAITTKDNISLSSSNNFENLAQKYNIPIVIVNQVGAVDNISFDGQSQAYNADGDLIARAKSFEEQLLIVNPYKNVGNIYALISPQEKNNKFTLDYEDDLEYTYKTVIQGIKDYFSKCNIKRAVLGLSGGLDSSVCAVLLADALGKSNVLGVSMPSRITSKESKTDAEQLSNNLGINFVEVPIIETVSTMSNTLNSLFTEIETKWENRYKNSYTMDNIQARSRSTILWGICNEFASSIPIATSDKSEAYMGYATINGDMSGGYAPIADITKTKLFALARWLNKNREEKNVIPESIILKKPGAELAIDEKTGKPLIAEDALMPYEFLDEVIWRIETNHETYSQMINSEFLYEKHSQLTQTQKTEWLDKFYKRMSSALYKWSIMPPSVIIGRNSINGCIYKQPITSSSINYKGVDCDYVNESLK